ncbi:MAG: hypothetical protein IJX80_10275 [Clostridia bacterium]|nr:hypothetical protein [Clostridia bacterium]
MKRVLALLLLISMLSLCSCDLFGASNTPDSEESDSVTSTESDGSTEAPSDEISLEETATEEPPSEKTMLEEETTLPTDDEAEDDEYLEISARSVEAFERRFFDFEECQRLLYLDLPSDWELSAAEEGYRIAREGRVIGTLVLGGKQGSSDWKLLDTDISQGGEALCEHYLEKDGIGETLRFRHRYYLRFVEGKRRILTLTVDYSELDGDAAQHLLATVGVISKSLLDPGFGTLTEAQWGSIAILGNSFISTSKIGGILNDMHTQNGKACYINSMSRGYAHIDTYVNDEALMEEIVAGTYDAVFICGVNSNSYLGKLKDICDSSGTTLVIFPAHNESQSNIDSAREAYPDVQIVDWKGEIEALINDGRNRWDFCMDDQHLHSTPLAGYVGAHMIFRAIWGEVPTGESTYGVTQREIESILGEYASTGRVIDVDEDDIYEMK